MCKKKSKKSSKAKSSRDQEIVESREEKRELSPEELSLQVANDAGVGIWYAAYLDDTGAKIYLFVILSI